ncbi:GNAT family N-acetyltransferase [Vibrio makurazakiensis]|uniref:GNAT family N-acetyltransferase n=1 Tax=Vibrio makurazakiensis TaxID=2910250 RepID=UPI003D0F7031
MKLVSPAECYQTAFLRFVDDFTINDPENAKFYSEACVSFSYYVKSLNNQALGINLPKFYVPCSHFWLLTDTDDVAGVIRVRHNIDNEFLSLEAGHIGYDIAPSYRRRGFGKHMLRLALKEAKLLGLKQVLITADEDNVASRKVIEANKGVLDKVIQGKVFPSPIARYWVECEPLESTD